MKKTFSLVAVLALLASCTTPPARPEGLWNSLPSSEGDAAKTAPSKVWEGPSVNVSEAPVEVSESPAVQVAGAVVLNEIFYDSADSDTDGNLFMELYGTPGLDIGGCKISFVNGADGGVYDSILIPKGETLREDGFYVIADAKTGAPTVSNVAGADLVDNFDPQNGPDAIQLIDAAGQLVDAVGYGDGILSVGENGLSTFEGTPGPDVAGGHSLERRQLGLDTNDNSADFVDLSEPTPGRGPAVPQTPETIPDEPATSQPEPEIPAEEPTQAPESPQGTVVLNEIFYDAMGTDTDGVLFVELYGTESLPIGGYRINFVDGQDGSVDDTVILPEGACLRSNGFYVVGDAKSGLPSETYIAGADFIDNFDPANGPDAVQLVDPQGGLVDAVGYGEGVVGLGQNGLADFEGMAAMDVVNGHSLERSQPGLDTLDNSMDFVDREVPTPGW